MPVQITIIVSADVHHGLSSSFTTVGPLQSGSQVGCLVAAWGGRGLADGNIDRTSSTRHAALWWRRAKQREGVVVKVGF